MDNYQLSNLLLILSIVIVLIAQAGIYIAYAKYKSVKNNKGITGGTVAREILDKNGLSKIYVTETTGSMSDHYDPQRKVIKLSKDVYEGETIAALAIAAHEVGHAIQDKDGYSFMKVRSAIYPIVNLSSFLGYFTIVIGIVFSLVKLIWIGIAFEIVILLFQLITLPVEFNASARAKKQLEQGTYLDISELKGSRVILIAAAFTYVASLLSNLLQIFRLVLVARDRR